MQSRLEQLFGIDVRTLAFVRMGLAGLVLVDLAMRARDLTAHYTDGGVLPRDALITEFLMRWQWSFHVFNGTTAFQAGLFVVAAVVATSMLLGYRTRAAAIATWVLLCSLQTRNPAVNYGVDDALRMFVFWGAFLPLGAAWSVDELIRPTFQRNPRVTIGGLAFMGQVCLIYVVTFILKNDPAWRQDFTAVYYALSLDEMVTPIGMMVRSHPTLMKVLTFVTIVAEAIAPILVFIPFQNARIRVAVIAVMMMVHLGMGLCLDIGLFPFVMWLGWWIFIPGELWDRLGFSAPLPPPTDAPTEQSQLSRLRSAAAGALAVASFCYVLLYNVQTIENKRSRVATLRPLNAFGTALNLKQNWGLFAPRPHGGDGWYVLPAELASGEHVDLFRDAAPVTFDKPESVAAEYPNARWQKYLVHLRNPETSRHIPYYLEYVCNRWNQRHLGTNQIVRSVEMYFVEERTLPDGASSLAEERLLASRDCS